MDATPFPIFATQHLLYSKEKLEGWVDVLGKPDLVAVPNTNANLHELFRRGGKLAHNKTYDNITSLSKFPPMQHQKESIKFLINNMRAFDLSEMGTGKTASAIWAAEILRSMGIVQRVLILCPLTCVHSVWVDEIFNLAMSRNVGTLLAGEDRKRDSIRNFDYVVMNHDGIKFQNVRRLTKDYYPQLIILDESAEFKSELTKKHASLTALVKHTYWFWQLTGSPTPNSPVDAYGQILLAYPFWRMTKTKFSYMTTMKVAEYKYIPTANAKQVVHEHMRPAIRHERAKCLTLPPQMFSTRRIAMSKQQTSAFNSMLDTYIAEADGEIISAANAAVKVSKLLQIMCGFVYNANKKAVLIDGPNPRMDAVNDVIAQTEHKVLVFTPFTSSVGLLAKHVTAHAVTIHGGTTKPQRNERIKEFKNNPDVRVMIANPRTMAHGLTLNQADTVLWFAPPFGLTPYEQATARNYRKGQDKHTFVIHFESTAIDKKMFATLRSRGNMQKGILDLYATLVKKSQKLVA